MLALIGVLSGCPGLFLSWLPARTKAGHRDEVDGHSASADYWLRCLYKGEQGDPEDVEKGFLKSELLVRVRAFICSSNFPCRLLTIHPLDIQGHIYITILSRR